jgi:chromosome segregation ATPase
MVDTTDIEKKSLEAHVELCAERYRLLETKMETIETNVSALKELIQNVHAMVTKMAEKRNDQLLAWGFGIIGSLMATVGWLIFNYVLK